MGSVCTIVKENSSIYFKIIFTKSTMLLPLLSLVFPCLSMRITPPITSPMRKTTLAAPLTMTTAREHCETTFCTEEGLFPEGICHPDFCQRDCTPVFNTVPQVCDWPWNNPECSNPGTTTPSSTATTTTTTTPISTTTSTTATTTTTMTTTATNTTPTTPTTASSSTTSSNNCSSSNCTSSSQPPFSAGCCLPYYCHCEGPGIVEQVPCQSDFVFNPIVGHCPPPEDDLCCNFVWIHNDNEPKKG